MQVDSMAKEALGWAKRELFEEDRITENMGGLVPEAAAGGIGGTGIGATAAFVQIRAHKSADEVAPPPPPETFGADTKRGG